MPLPTLQKLNIAQPQPGTMKLQAMKMQDMQTRTGLAKQGLKLEREGLGLRKETLELNKSSKKLDNLLRFMPTLTKEEWQPFREHIKSIDPDLADLLPDDVSEMLDDEWNETVNRITFGAEAMSKMKQKKYDKTIKDAAEVRKQEAATALQTQKDEASMARTKITAGAKGDAYKTDKAKQIDDTRSYYHEESRQLMDPESGLIRQGPADNPTKYIDEYQKILGRMKKDMKRIKNGKLPSWYEGENEGAKSDDDISQILKDGGFDATPATIKKFRENNPDL